MYSRTRKTRGEIIRTRTLSPTKISTKEKKSIVLLMGHNKVNNNKSQANVVEDKEDNFVAVVTVSMICNKIAWWVETRVTKHLS